MTIANVAACESTSSPANTRRRSTEGPACTSPSSSALRRDIDVQVRCFGGPRDEAGTTAYATLAEFATANAALATMGVDLLMAQDAAGADLVHSGTWYANFAGFTAKQLHDIPHVVTAHSLEPLRPWKAEQLGGGYRVSSWVEKTAFEDADAVIAVSDGMRRDILRSYPASTPSASRSCLQRHRPDRPEAQPRPRPGARSASTPTVPRSCSSAGSPRRPAIPAARPARCRPTCSSCCARARPTPWRSWRGGPACTSARREAPSGSTGTCRGTS